MGSLAVLIAARCAEQRRWQMLSGPHLPEHQVGWVPFWISPLKRDIDRNVSRGNEVT